MKSFKLGLKGSTDPKQIENRLSQKGIDIYEFHLVEEDLFGDRIHELERAILRLKVQGVKVYLHHPMKCHEQILHINDEISKAADFFILSTRILVDLCERYDCYVVVHWNYGRKNSLPEPDVAEKKSLIHTISRTIQFDEKYGKGRILWENGVRGVGAIRKDMYLANLIVDTQLKLCFDVSHAFISLNGDNDILFKTIELLQHQIHYYHVVDSMGINHDSLMIGQGMIDFPQILPFILEKDYIYEIMLSDNLDCREMMESHRIFKELGEVYLVEDNEKHH
ncbi:Sugar phosphate isomerase/epimerase OS=Ureibacillus acetophenoni OX=614649 GN=SAMN05877842_104190 PE=4 SV=1 [Ureibacillus acetophenoni]